MDNKSVTLIEILIVVIIVGILATLSMPLFTKTRERGLDQEVNANLKLIQAAEKIYSMETGEFLSCTGSGSITCMNTNLRLSLPKGTTRSWNYNITVTASDFNALADRFTNASVWSRSWTIDKDDDEPSCSGARCPP